MGSFAEIGINLKGRKSGQMKTLCPKCSHDRGKNKKEPCLSVNIDEGIFNCHHCGWSGSVNDKPSRIYYIPKFNDTELSDKVLKYLMSRGLTKDIIKRHKVTEEASFIHKDQAEVTCIVFNYFRDGELVNRKFRSASKGFKMEADAELIIYNLDSISGDYAVLTEGEIDCLSVDQAGFPSCGSVPNGASKGNNNLQYLETAYKKFKDIRKIYLAMDADEPGQKLMHELAIRFGRDRCYQVRYPEGCKDPNETLMKHGAHKLKECIKNAEPFPIEGVINVEDIRDDVIRLYRKGVDRGFVLRDLGDEWTRLCTYKTSLLYVWTGIPAHGKSSFVQYQEVLMASQYGWKWAIFSPEHYPMEYMILKYAELLIGQPFFDGPSQRMSEMSLQSAINFIKDHFYFIRPEGDNFSLDNVLEVTRSLVFRYGVKGFTLDAWNNLEHDFGHMTETQYVERALNKLNIFKQVNDLCIFLVAHPTKIKKNQAGLYEVPTLYDISGSSNFFNKCDFGISVYRDFNLERTMVYVQKCKFRNLGDFGFTPFKYNKLSNRFHPFEGIEYNNTLLPQPKQQVLITGGDEDLEYMFNTEGPDDVPF